MRPRLRPALLALAAALAAGAAQAEPASGGGDMPPEMSAARQAAREACAADAKTYCDGQTGRERMMCMRQNADKLSEGCKDALAKLPMHGHRPAS